MSSHDAYKHLKVLGEILASNKTPIAFFISAGCPLSVKNETGDPLIPDMKGILNYLNQKLGKDKSISVNYKKLLDNLNCYHGGTNFNLEDVLSFVRDMKNASKGGGIVREFNEAELSLIEEKICENIAMKLQVDLPDGNTPYNKLVRWIASIERECAIEIFTTNYDLLMEQALEMNDIPYFDGFVGSKHPFFDLKSVEEDLIPAHWIRLWKMHGSINWRYAGNRVVRIYDSNSNKQDNNSCLIYPSHLKYDQSRKMPFLALSDRLTKFLKKSSSILFISGYSFGDEHINNVIVNALKSNSRSNVIAFAFGKLSDYTNGCDIAKKMHNFSIWADDKAIIGTREAEWRINDAKQNINFFENLLAKDKDDCSKILTLGDFNDFAELLNHFGSNMRNEL